MRASADYHSMTQRLLISGDRSSFTTLDFDPSAKTLILLANYASPFNASWIEPVCYRGQVDCLVGLSEGDESGLLYSFEIDHDQKTCRITNQQSTLGAPAHFTTLRDGCTLALATYLGGSVALYPISICDRIGVSLTGKARTEILPVFPGRPIGHGPNTFRQRQCHPHQVLEDKRGILYVPDLGSDRVWILRREKMRLGVCGWLQCPPGHGPRHAVLTPDEKLMYVVGELSHTVAAFDLSKSPAEAIKSIEGFAPNVIPPTIDTKHQSMMDSSEICQHPYIPNILYVSNRWARHIIQREPDLRDVPKELPHGDSVAIILLSSDGREVEVVKHVQTKIDVIRGMRLSNNCRHIAVVGQAGGGIEIYSIGGQRGDVWTLVTGLDEGLEGGIKHVVWL